MQYTFTKQKDIWIYSMWSTYHQNNKVPLRAYIFQGNSLVTQKRSLNPYILAIGFTKELTTKEEPCALYNYSRPHLGGITTSLPAPKPIVVSIKPSRKIPNKVYTFMLDGQNWMQVPMRCNTFSKYYSRLSWETPCISFIITIS